MFSDLLSNQPAYDFESICPHHDPLCVDYVFRLSSAAQRELALFESKLGEEAYERFLICASARRCHSRHMEEHIFAWTSV